MITKKEILGIRKKLLGNRRKFWEENKRDFPRNAEEVFNYFKPKLGKWKV